MKFAFSSTAFVLKTALFLSLWMSCSSVDNPEDNNTSTTIGQILETENSTPIIDFTNWKLTLPVDLNNNGSPDEFQPNQLVGFGYQNETAIQPYLYDDTSDNSLVFYSIPDVSTSNSSYSRTELRELINPNNAKQNWSLNDGGEMIGRLQVVSISEDADTSANFHKVIVMQIHGIISEEDMAIHGFSSNNGPPLIKIYWKDGYIWSHKKSLIDQTTSGDALLETSSATWFDIKHNLGYVGFEAFDFRILASTGRVEVQLNNQEPLVYTDVSLNKWPFHNYFKAGNYLGTTSPNGFAYIKYFSLNVIH
jgi:hypothetical protein